MATTISGASVVTGCASCSNWRAGGLLVGGECARALGIADASPLSNGAGNRDLACLWGPAVPNVQGLEWPRFGTRGIHSQVAVVLIESYLVGAPSAAGACV